MIDMNEALQDYVNYNIEIKDFIQNYAFSVLSKYLYINKHYI